MKTSLFILCSLLIICKANADTGLALQNSVNQQYFTTIINKNALTKLEVPNDVILPIPNSQVPNYSYFYNGQYSIMDIQCIVNKRISASDIYIKYDNKIGIQSVTGICQVQLNGAQPFYIMPLWDGNPHGTILFNESLKHV